MNFLPFLQQFANVLCFSFCLFSFFFFLLYMKRQFKIRSDDALIICNRSAAVSIDLPDSIIWESFLERRYFSITLSSPTLIVQLKLRSASPADYYRSKQCVPLETSSPSLRVKSEAFTVRHARLFLSQRFVPARSWLEISLRVACSPCVASMRSIVTSN